MIMKVSVVIPSYNEEKVIGRCLNALTNQTVKADEIIVVDNNCHDQTVKIAQKFPVRIIKETKQGISYARNAGFNAAKHEIIGRIDADTTVFPNWVEELKKGFTNEQTVAVTGPYRFRGLLMPSLNERFNSFLFINIPRLIHKHYLTYGSNMGLRRSAWKKVRSQVIMDNRQVHEDWDLAIWLAKIGKIEFLKELRVEVSPRRPLNFPSNIEYLYRYGKMLYRLYITHTYQFIDRDSQAAGNAA
jgi:glycosyltransferase involved in cell wall biosynthesis